MACHPLPRSFYEGGGLQSLRHRFDGASDASGVESDFFSYSSASSATAVSRTKENTAASLGRLSDNSIPVKNTRSKYVSPPSKNPRHTVHAGDLLVAKDYSSEHRPSSRVYNIHHSPYLPHPEPFSEKNSRTNRAGIPSDDFDLRQEVMSCIAKSIGLLQPPMSGSDSASGSPAMAAQDTRRPAGPVNFNSPFSSLSLLDIGDDTSSMTGTSSVFSTGDYMRGIDNEVEILCYPAGSTLAKAGEANTGDSCEWAPAKIIAYFCIGLFYVIDGFLEILLPAEAKDNETKSLNTPSSHQDPEHFKDERSKAKVLFTVKPGGIAGYLGVNLLLCVPWNQGSKHNAQLHYAMRPLMWILGQKLILLLVSFPLMLWKGYWRNVQLFC
jgi:lysophospholipid hydrolase